MKTNISIIILLLLSVNIFAQNSSLEIHGHAGARGLYPENSIIGFKKAIDYGVSAIEMDVVISKDKKVVVSHDTYFSKEICYTSDKKRIRNKVLLYDLDYKDIRKYDCGCNGNPKFKQQKKISTYKPLLLEVIDSIENYSEDNNIIYNIEIKSRKANYGKKHPLPSEFVKLVLQEIASRNIMDRVIIQSFDVNILKEMKRQNPAIKTLLLVFNLKGFRRNIKRLGFMPTYYAPNYKFINNRTIKKAHENNILIVAWTVNDLELINKLKNKGVDIIMTDFPNLVEKL